MPVKRDRHQHPSLYRGHAGTNASITTLADFVGPVVYYVHTRGDLIKIGYTADLAVRIASYGGWRSLLAVQSGTLTDERELHERFRPHRALGVEYYHPAEELFDHIDALLATYSLGPVRRWAVPARRIPAPLGPLLDSAMAAVAAEVDPSTIRSWVVSGRLRNHGTARSIRVDSVALAELLERRPPADVGRRVQWRRQRGEP